MKNKYILYPHTEDIFSGFELYLYCAKCDDKKLVLQYVVDIATIECDFFKYLHCDESHKITDEKDIDVIIAIFRMSGLDGVEKIIKVFNERES